MRRATAVRRLRTIAERCRQVCSLWEPGEGLVGVLVFGSLLDEADQDGSIEVIQLALVVSRDADEVTWCSRPPTFSGLPYVLDLEKAPVDWYFRPASRPVANHRIVRPLPIWARDGGVHEAALAALADGDPEALDRIREPAPRPGVLERQLGEELEAAAAQLQRVRDRYWARGWRQTHHAAGASPENYLWDAANGYLDLLAAVGGAPGSPQAAAAAAVAEQAASEQAASNQAASNQAASTRTSGERAGTGRTGRRRGPDPRPSPGGDQLPVGEPVAEPLSESPRR